MHFEYRSDLFYFREIQWKYRFSLGQVNVLLLLFRNILLLCRQLDPAAECPEWAGAPLSQVNSTLHDSLLPVGRESGDAATTRERSSPFSFPF